MKILAIYIATGKYLTFFDSFKESYIENFCVGEGFNRDILLLTNSKYETPIHDRGTIIYQRSIEQLPWPMNTLLRYHYMNRHRELLSSYDYVYFFNANTKILKPISSKDLGNKGTVVSHYAFHKSPIYDFPYCRVQNSKAFVDHEEWKMQNYVMGGFNGFSKEILPRVIDTITEWIDTDLKANIIPIWHDESYLNKYCVMNPEIFRVLSPSYGSFPG
jgi:hypothetical protein